MTAAVYRRFGPPEVVHLEQVRKPTPKADEVLVKVHASTVSVADSRSRSRTIPQGLGLLAAIGIGFWAAVPQIERRAALFRLLTAMVVWAGSIPMAR